MRRFLPIAALLFAFAPATAGAEFRISVYGGANTANGSDLTLEQGGVSTEFDVDWEGNSFEMPPYYGVRGTYWLTEFGRPRWGLAVDFTHAKVEADLDAALSGTFSHLEFTNGLNSLTLNGLYRAPLNNRFSLYAGGGAGASIPYVEVTTIAPASETREYQVTGPVVQALAGADMKVGHSFSLFGEYKASYSWNDADLNGGGSVETDILAHHFAVGLSYSFGNGAP